MKISKKATLLPLAFLFSGYSKPGALIRDEAVNCLNFGQTGDSKQVLYG
jgi:hypothetical protein